LRGFLFLANEGRIRRRYYEEQLNQASCLNLVTNAVVLWNTVYMRAVLDQLKAEGQHVDDADVVHLSKSGLLQNRRVTKSASAPPELTYRSQKNWLTLFGEPLI
jgi:Tn3 transposase DDE domain